ncbi:hypothetical protein O0L34_g6356 [Tuta absoluta]|nr:hypothetical protein O0L34_g6356 [Tuta absoluta]
MEPDVQMPSTSSTPMETEDIVPSTSTVPFAVPHTTYTVRTNAQRQREYRQRQASTRTPEQVAALAKAAAEKRRESRKRQAASRTPEQAKAFATAAAERQRRCKLRKTDFRQLLPVRATPCYTVPHN